MHIVTDRTNPRILEDHQLNDVKTVSSHDDTVRLNDYIFNEKAFSYFSYDLVTKSRMASKFAHKS
jgi:hypothetical protein